MSEWESAMSGDLRERIEQALDVVNYPGEQSTTGALVDAVMPVVEARLAEVEQALHDLIAWVGQIGYPYDFTTIPVLPDQFVRPLAEWWWRDSGEGGTVDEWEAGIADEAGIAVRAAVLDKGEQPLKLFKRPADAVVLDKGEPE